MSNRFEGIVRDVVAEVERAKQQWGEEFDRRNTLNDWNQYVNLYLSEAAKMGKTFEEIETNLRKAAGLVIAALEMHLREGLAPRHYEGQARPKSLPEIQK